MATRYSHSTIACDTLTTIDFIKLHFPSDSSAPPIIKSKIPNLKNKMNLNTEALIHTFLIYNEPAQSLVSFHF